MAQRHKPKDPFALFSAAQGLCDSDFSSDDDGSDEETKENNEKSEEPKFISKSSGKDTVDKSLPPPDFEKKKKSSFLEDKTTKDIDWDKMAKDDTIEEDVPDLSNTNAIPPPKSYESVTDKLKPTIGDTSTPDIISTKRSHPDSHSETDSKKLKL